MELKKGEKVTHPVHGVLYFDKYCEDDSNFAFCNFDKKLYSDFTLVCVDDLKI